MISKGKHATVRFSVILCSALVVSCPQVSARPPRPRVLSGEIETIDQNARILRIRGGSEATPLTFVWNNRTRFLERDRVSASAELTKGASVTIWYGTPFFGERYATKIILWGGAVRPAKRRLP
jgi:hypothetical protein